MRLCIVTEYFDDTGSTPTILSSLAGYLRRAHPETEIDVIASRNSYRGDERYSSGTTADGIRVIRLATPKSNGHATLPRLAAGMAFTIAAMQRLYAGPRYDAVLIVTNPPSVGMAGHFTTSLRGIPFVYLIHDLYPDVAVAVGLLAESHPIARATGRLQKGWLHSAAKVVVLGRCMRDHLERRYSLPAHRVEVITNWSDPSEFVPTGTSAFRKRHDIGGVTVLYAGNFGRYQDFDDILAAARRLRDLAPDVTVMLVGHGTRDAEIRGRIARDNLANVKVFPMVATREYPDVLAAADIALVLLAKGAEGVGVPSKFYNVLASGRPVVAVVARDSEVGLVVAETESGVQIDHGDSERLASVITELASDAELRKRLGQNARRTVLEQYTLDRVGERFWRLLNEVKRQPAAL